MTKPQIRFRVGANRPVEVAIGILLIGFTFLIVGRTWLFHEGSPLIRSVLSTGFGLSDKSFTEFAHASATDGALRVQRFFSLFLVAVTLLFVFSALLYILFRKKSVINLLLMVTTTLICAAVGEFLLWRFAPVEVTEITRQYFKPSQNPNIIYEPAANAGEFNSDGFRDGEYRREKTSSVYRIVVIGDSLAYGAGHVGLRETYAKKLEQFLNQRVAGSRRFEVLNFGVPGYQTTQIVERLKEKGLSYDPDLIIYGYWWNDVATADQGELGFFSDPFNRRMSSWMNPNMSESLLVREIKHILLCSQIVRRVLLLVREASAGNRRPIEAFPLSEQDPSMSPAVVDLFNGYLRAYQRREVSDRLGLEPYVRDYTDRKNFLKWTKALRELSDICHVDGRDCVLLMTPVLSGYDPAGYHYEALHQFVKSVAALYSLNVLDLTSRFHEEGVQELASDVSHPNSVGHEVIAEALYQYLTENHMLGAI